MSEVKVPKKFEDYKVADLRDIAENEFAVEVGENATKSEVLAALTESGVTFQMHIANHPEFAPKEEPKAAPGVVTASQMQAEEPEEEPVETTIVVKEEVPLASKEEWLIKMVRANPLYEVKGYKFTQKNPFNLVDPVTAEFLLTRLDGFRQATPAELQEYYG